jgi:hypothetical protein
VRRLLIGLSEAVHWLTGTGAAVNARFEVDRATRSVADHDAQLDVASWSTSRRAA